MRRLLPLLLVAACRREEPQPPDPNRPMPAVECGPEVPVGFARTEPESALTVPPWLTYCGLCPPGNIEIDYGAELASGWSADGLCAYAMPTDPPPDEDTVPVDVTLRVDERVGAFRFDVPLPPRGQDPQALGTATWRLPLDGALVHPALPAEGPDLLLAWDPLTGAATLGIADDAGQDLCAPTVALTAPLALQRRALAGPLEPGQALPLPWAQAVRRGALQARVTSTGSALNDVTLLAVFDAALLEAVTGVPAAETCAAAEAAAGAPVCGPCDPPDALVSGFPACWTAVYEWPEAIREPAVLVPVTEACAG